MAPISYGALGAPPGSSTSTASESEHVADRPEAVHHQRGARGHQVDDRVGEAEAGRHLDGPGDRDDLDVDPRLGEEPPGDVGVGRRNAAAGQVVNVSMRCADRDGRGEAAAPEAEKADGRQVDAGLAQQIDARDAEVGHAVADELHDVVRSDEEDVQVVVLDAGDQAALLLREDEPGVVQEGHRGLDETPLVGHRKPQPAVAVALGTAAIQVPRSRSLGHLGARSFNVAPRSSQALEHEPVAAFAVLEPGIDPRDRGRAGARLAGDLRVVQARFEHADDRPALGHIVQFAEGAEVAEEALRLLAGLESRIAAKRS